MAENIIRVGPVHAGIIGPGVFEFRCLGERVVGLDVELGYCHRGIEKRIIESQHSALRMMCIAEQIAGDTTIGHALAMAQLLERGDCSRVVKMERVVALELERLAMNFATLGALGSDIGFQLGQVSCEALRTLVVNGLQRLCGSRYGRTLIRPGGSYYRIDIDRCDDIIRVAQMVSRRSIAIEKSWLRSASVVSRLEDVGKAGDCGRYGGDLMSRVVVCFKEVAESCSTIVDQCKELKGSWYEDYSLPSYEYRLPGDTIEHSEVMGWRGVIRHSYRTDLEGMIVEYRVEDPSVRLWGSLVESVEGGDLSDFPLNNKSFNLSYSGSDL